MNQLINEFREIKNVYERTSAQSGLVCKTGIFEDSPFVKLHRDSWMSGNAGIFFAVWTDKNSQSMRRVHYNIHALKVRQLKSYVIASRDFANAFRKDFKSFCDFWPNVRVDYGPLNLMQGWIELREKTFQRDVLQVMRQFEQVHPIIDRLLGERIVPLRRRPLDNKRR